MTPRTLRRVYLREAAVMLAFAKLAVRILPARALAGASFRRRGSIVFRYLFSTR